MATRSDLLRLRIDVDEKGATRDVKKFQKDVERSNRKVAASNKRVAGSFEKARLSVARMRNMTLLVAFSISATAIAINRLAKQAEKVSGLSRAFQTLGKRANLNARAIRELRVATRYTVSDMELMRLTNNALILGVAKTQEGFVGLAKDAVTLGRAVGLDATMAVESLVTGIGRQSRQMLDNLGIIVSVKEANDKYADSLGRAVDSLTLLEQKEGFRLLALEKIADKTRGLADDTTSLSDKWNKLATTVTNTTNSMLDDINRLPESKGAGLVNLLLPGSPFPEGQSVLKSMRQGEFGLTPGEAREGRRFRARELAGQGVDERRALKIAGHKANIAATEAQIKAGKELRKRQAKWAKDHWAEQETTLRNMEEQRRTSLAIGERPAGLGLESPFPVMDFSAAPQNAFGPIESREDPWNFEAAKTKGQEFSEYMRGEFTSATAAFASGLIDAFDNTSQSIKEMIKNLLVGLAKAIVKAMIFRAIMAATGGGAAATPFTGMSFIGFMAKGGVVGAANGTMVRGGTPGRDSVPIMAQRGEAVLPRALTSFLMGAARSSLAGGQPGSRQTLASRAAPSTVNIAKVEVITSDIESFERNPERLHAAIRQATLVGAY